MNVNQAEELYNAINQERFADARRLLESGAGVHFCDPGDFPNTGLTALHWASFYGQLDLVLELLDRGADLEATDEMGRTPLVCAAMTGHSQVVELLLSRGSDLRAMSYRGWTLIPQTRRSKDVVAVLQQYGYDEPSDSRDVIQVSESLPVHEFAPLVEYSDFIAGVRHQEVYGLLIHGLLVPLQGLSDNLHAEFIEKIETAHKSLSQLGADEGSLSNIEVATSQLLTASDFRKLVTSQTEPGRMFGLASRGTQTFDKGMARIRETLPRDNSLRYTMGIHTASACFQAAMILSVPHIFSGESVFALHKTHSQILTGNARFTRSNLQLYLGTDSPAYEEMPSYLQCILAITVLVEKDPGISQETALKIVNLSRDLFDFLGSQPLSIALIEGLRVLNDPRARLLIQSVLQHASETTSSALRALARYSLTSDPNDLDVAVADAEREAAQQTADKLAHAIRLNVLGGALWERFLNSGMIADLERSIQIADEILSYYLDTPAESSVRNNLGLALEMKFSFSKERAILDRSIDELTRAVYPIFPLSSVSSIWRHNLGNALRTRYDNFHDARDLNLAIIHLTRALKLTSEDSKDLALHRFSLANAFMDRCLINENSVELDHAVELYEMALGGTPEESPDFPKFAFGLANAIKLRHELRSASADLVYARRIYRQAVRLGMNRAKGYVLKHARAWGDWAFRRHALLEAAEAYSYAFTASDSLHTAQLNREAKEAWLQDTQGLAAHSAYVQIKIRQLNEAATQLERGIARLASEQLDTERTHSATDHHSLSPCEHSALLLKPFGIETIRDIATETPVVYLSSIAEGGFALIVGREDVETVVWLPGLTSGRVDGLLRLYQRAYTSRHIREQDWINALDTITEGLWSLAMSPILEAVDSLPALILIPVGSLSLFPFHAAWRPEPSRISGRLYACDMLSISYAPKVLALTRQRSTKPGADVSFVGVKEPKLSHLPPLPYAQAEVAVVSRMFPESREIAGREATRKAVLASLDSFDVAHIAWHAKADLLDPLRGCIYLAEDETLTLEEILSERFHQLRLAVLSACETGIPGTKLPDEVVGLSTGLIQAGVPSVVASLWSVSDRPTSLLMIRFYYLWRLRSVEPVFAFGDAQRWLRDSTNGEKLVFLITLKEQLGHIPEIDLLIDELAKEDETQRHYLHPFIWAAFTWTGSRLF